MASNAQPLNTMPALHRRHLLAAGLAWSAGRALATPDDSPFWRLLREGGCVVLMRHALTEPGIGDPPGFRLDQCSSQRRLSDEGRAQARRVGKAFERAGVTLAEVRSSAWCRCTDTADLAFGRHTVWAPLNSFFQTGDRDSQTSAVLQAVAGVRAPANWMLVTHQVNITALTGETPAMGELFVTRPGASDGRLRVLARGNP